MNTSENSDSHDRSNEIEAPVPTIVGPRPEAAPGATISVPRGMESLLTLAAMNEDWKDKTLADPLRAAAEADIQLSPSESAILKAIPAKTLGQMILSIIRTRLAPIRDTALAAGTASAALLAATDVLGEVASLGIRPDIPPEPAEPAVPAPAQIKWEATLAAALKQAAASKRAVMVVCPYGAKAVDRGGPPGSAGITMEVPTSRFLQELCRDGNKSVAAAVATARLIAVKASDEAATPKADAPVRKSYVAMLEKYGVADAAPLVLFLAPDGTVLHREQAADERKLVAAVEAVPVLLAKWLTAKQPPADPAPPATKGHTKD
jgi:hypothetical protein